MHTLTLWRRRIRTLPVLPQPQMGTSSGWWHHFIHRVASTELMLLPVFSTLATLMPIIANILIWQKPHFYSKKLQFSNQLGLEHWLSPALFRFSSRVMTFHRHMEVMMWRDFSLDTTLLHWRRRGLKLHLFVIWLWENLCVSKLPTYSGLLSDDVRLSVPDGLYWTFR